MLRIYGLRAQSAVFMRIYAAYIRICDRLKLIIFVETLKWRKLDNTTDTMKMIIIHLCLSCSQKHLLKMELGMRQTIIYLDFFKVN